MAEGIVRIIGGRLRGRKLKVPDLPGLRPTPDRVRETLFNWLMPVIQGAQCLDAFAGSGVLGFEALSRGAAGVVMTDASAAVITLLQQESIVLQTSQAEIYRATLPAQLKVPAKPFDIVFLDPPYQAKVLLPVCFYLEEKQLLAREAYLYLEADQPITEQQLPSNWQLIKQNQAGQVAYHLVLRTEKGAM